MKNIYCLLLALVFAVGCAGTKAPAKPEPAQAGPPAVPQMAPDRTEPRQVAELSIGESRGLTFTPVYFDFDKSNIRPDQKSTVAGLVQWLTEDSNLEVKLAGHCDERGTLEYNLALGQRRAESVKFLLEQYGIAGDRIRTVSYGEGLPVDAGHNEQAWARNRRVEHVVTGLRSW